MKKKTPLVSIIIVSWNGGRVLQNCLQSLAKINYPKWELIFVDNGSTDGSPKSIKSITGTKSIKRIEIIQNTSNLGFATANNQGYKKARGKYILLLNNDTTVLVDFLSKLVARMERDLLVGVVQPKIKLMDKPGYLDNAGSFFTRIGFLQHWGFLKKDNKEFDAEREIFSAKGACMLIRRSVVDEVGLFDDSFFSYFEESDFCWRVWLSGFEVIYYPQTTIYHKVGFTIRRLNVSHINYHYYKNRMRSLIKNLETPNLFIILIPHLLISLGISILFLIKLQFGNSFIVFRALYWNLFYLPSTWRKRRFVQATRKISDKRLFQKLARPVNWVQYWKDFRRVEKDLNG